VGDGGNNSTVRSYSSTTPTAKLVRRQDNGTSDADHKVIVKFCEGYECQRSVTTHRVRQNIHGHREYCSLVCYSRWSPAMRARIAAFPMYNQSPNGLERLILDLRKEHGITGAAEVLGISRSTVSYWLRKLSFYRQFPGQSPSMILAQLKTIAQYQGLPAAAKLIQVDPKTLHREFVEQGLYTNTDKASLAAS